MNDNAHGTYHDRETELIEAEEAERLCRMDHDYDGTCLLEKCPWCAVESKLKVVGK